MKKIVYLFVIFSVFTITVKAQSAEETKVATAVQTLNKAIVDADKNILESLTANELSYGHSGGKIENKTQFVAALTSGNVDFISIDIADQTVQVAGKNATVRHTFTAKIISDGKNIDLKIGSLMVWQKQKGKWKLLARQGYKL